MSDKDKNIPILADYQSQEWKDKVSQHKEEQTTQDKLPNSTKPNGQDKPKAMSEDKQKKDEKAKIPTLKEVRERVNKAEKKVEKEIPSLSEVRNRKTTITSNTSKSVSSVHIDTCKKLKEKDTTFVFVYGASQSGKSCFLVSLLNHLSKDRMGRLEPRRINKNREAHLALRKMYVDFRDGILPTVTQTKSVYELDFLYTPESPKIPAKFTFLEMSGENLEHVYIQENKAGKLPEFVDEYLNCPDVKICFILTIPYNADKNWKNWAEVDYNTLDFLNYIKEKSPNFDASKLLCLISKWDSYEGPFKHSAKEFIQHHLPMTYQRLETMGNQISAYSVGDVMPVRDEKDQIIDYVQPTTINAIYPEKVKNWLYEAVTNRIISDAPWWERIFNWI